MTLDTLNVIAGYSVMGALVLYQLWHLLRSTWNILRDIARSTSIHGVACFIGFVLFWWLVYDSITDFKESLK